MDSPTRISNQAVECDYCGMENPSDSVACSVCRRPLNLQPPTTRRGPKTRSAAGHAIRIICGLVVILIGDLSVKGATFNSRTVELCAGGIVVVAVFAFVSARGNWQRFSDWFLGWALLKVVVFHFLGDALLSYMPRVP